MRNILVVALILFFHSLYAYEVRKDKPERAKIVSYNDTHYTLEFNDKTRVKVRKEAFKGKKILLLDTVQIYRNMALKNK